MKPECTIENSNGPVDLTPILDQLGGCLEGFCDVTGKNTGMHTNGGCYCLRWLHPGERHAAKDYLAWKREHATRAVEK